MILNHHRGEPEQVRIASNCPSKWQAIKVASKQDHTEHL